MRSRSGKYSQFCVPVHGYETVAGALDLSGAARIAENVIDIGAYEYQPSSLGLLLFVR